MLKNSIKIMIFCLLMSALSSCGFHLRGPMELAPPLHKLYLQAADPYSLLVKTLKLYLKVSHVQLVNDPSRADTILMIVSDTPLQQLLSVSGTQLTRQYLLTISVVIEIMDAKKRILLGPENFVESRVITIQSDQILGSSNETSLFYQQMRQAIAYAIMNRIASKEATKRITTAYYAQPVPPPTL